MRISDWSSDVCSSDLVDAGSGVEQAAPVDLDPAFARRHQAGDGEQHGSLAGPGMAGQCDHPGIVVAANVAAEPARSARATFDQDVQRKTTSAPSPRDRKTLVSGKSVSVHVDLGE